MTGFVARKDTDMFTNTGINITAVTEPVRRYQMLRIGCKCTGTYS